MSLKNTRGSLYMEPPIDDSLPMLSQTPPPLAPEEPVYYPIYYDKHSQKKVDFFAEMDKSIVMMMVAIFVIGFFMGKSMTPIILKSL